MRNFFTWLLEKLRQREKDRKSKIISRVLSPKKFKELESIIGVPIKDRSYFLQALMHRSFLEQNEEYDVSNERLEFLGDAVLNLSVAEYLFDEFPDKDEGFLTKVRAKLVNRVALAESAESINLSDFLLVSENLSNNFAHSSRTVLCDAFEALIGAIYLDSGLDSAKIFIERILIFPSAKKGEYLVDENFKSQLLEYAQANKLDIPNYFIVKEEGPQHNRTFTVQAFIGKEAMGQGVGRNKKSAEQKAAQAALKKIKHAG